MFDYILENSYPNIEDMSAEEKDLAINMLVVANFAIRSYMLASMLAFLSNAYSIVNMTLLLCSPSSKRKLKEKYGPNRFK